MLYPVLLTLYANPFTYILHRQTYLVYIRVQHWILVSLIQTRVDRFVRLFV